MKILEQAKFLKEAIDRYRPISKADELRIMQKFRLDWNYHSNNLEGNSLTYGETKALILFGLTAQGKPLKDHFEVKGHNEAIEWVIEVVKQERPLTESFIRQIHKLLLKEPYEVDAITPDGQPTKRTIKVGTYKSVPNHVKTKTGEIFRFATPEETPALMHDLINWYREKIAKKDVNHILLAAEFHYKFIRIHPFDDGNGRVARILMNFILMQIGYPPVIIKTEDKGNYFAALRQADAGIIEPFINYIASNLIYSLELMIKGLKGEDIEDPEDFFKEMALLEQRIENVSNPLPIVKSKEVLLKLYDDFIKDLAIEYVEKSKMFDKFYTSAKFHFEIGTEIEGYGFLKDIIINGKSKVSSHSKVIKLVYNYRTFNRTGFREFDNYSKIDIWFRKLTYEIKDSKDKLVIKKTYSENLTKEEIHKIVKVELDYHKENIEIHLKNIENSK